MSFTKIVLSIACGGLIGGVIVCSPLMNFDQPRILSRTIDENGSGAVTLLSNAYTLDRVYNSMLGPRSNHARIRLLGKNEPETTVWLTGVKSVIVDDDVDDDDDGGSEISPEYFCHANLTLSPSTTSPEEHNAQMQTHVDWRLFTLIPGRLAMELPEGFGIPISSETSLDYFTMALNQNPGRPERRIRIKSELSFCRSDAGQPRLRPLFRRAVYVYQQHSEAEKTGVFMTPAELEAHQGEACAITCSDNLRGGTPSLFADALTVGMDGSSDPLAAHPGASCCVENASVDGVLAQFGEENTVHWMVPPGRHVYRTEVTEQFQLPFDTTAHYVTGHLHPFGRSIRLIDMETREAIFEIESRDFDDRLGVERMSELVSREGVPVYRDRRYELVAEYENTTTRPIDAMAILYVYALDESMADSSVEASGGE